MWHAVAVRAVKPTRAGGLEAHHTLRAPEILFSNPDPAIAWRHCVQQIGAIIGLTNSPELCLVGNPIYVTNDWVYYLIQDKI